MVKICKEVMEHIKMEIDISSIKNGGLRLALGDKVSSLKHIESRMSGKTLYVEYVDVMKEKSSYNALSGNLISLVMDFIRLDANMEKFDKNMNLLEELE